VQFAVGSIFAGGITGCTTLLFINPIDYA